MLGETGIDPDHNNGVNAIIATLTTTELIAFVCGLFSDGEVDQAALRRHLTDVILQRLDEEVIFLEAKETASLDAVCREGEPPSEVNINTYKQPIFVPPIVYGQVHENHQLRKVAQRRAEMRLKAALAAIDLAKPAFILDNLQLLYSTQYFLMGNTLPWEFGAAEALRCVLALPHIAIVSIIERLTRDIFIDRCLTECENPKDRSEFLFRAEISFLRGQLVWDKDSRARLLMAVSKDLERQKDGWASNNAIATAKRPGRLARPRRKKTQ